MTNKNIKTSSLGRLEGHQERKINLIEDDLINDIGNSNLISSITNFYKIIYPEHLNQEEIERLKDIEKSTLVQSIRKEKISLNKSYSNEFSYAFEVI